MKMASVEALPSSRKQEHLEAEKRRLEEFRKKKQPRKPRKQHLPPKPMFLMLA
ncbi:hypothetical protein ES319_D08G113400v1 [Gossypium barbadense]|uniref:Uncharacterized protein n=2 Tax=Gossypium TaxID=3633 RepID=A0A5J5QIX8_GOSBA|nr:hypothetical protein ES319_D08G113400v1 [Gossypium barbadense]TYG57155.1 hypothetical protein ES288_D08G120400v1 [Gossypium darwinii]